MFLLWKLWYSCLLMLMIPLLRLKDPNKKEINVNFIYANNNQKVVAKADKIEPSSERQWKDKSISRNFTQIVEEHSKKTNKSKENKVFAVSNKPENKERILFTPLTTVEIKLNKKNKKEKKKKKKKKKKEEKEQPNENISISKNAKALIETTSVSSDVNTLKKENTGLCENVTKNLLMLKSILKYFLYINLIREYLKVREKFEKEMFKEDSMDIMKSFERFSIDFEKEIANNNEHLIKLLEYIKELHYTDDLKMLLQFEIDYLVENTELGNQIKKLLNCNYQGDAVSILKISIFFYSLFKYSNYSSNLKKGFFYLSFFAVVSPIVPFFKFSYSVFSFLPKKILFSSLFIKTQEDDEPTKYFLRAFRKLAFYCLKMFGPQIVEEIIYF